MRRIFTDIAAQSNLQFDGADDDNLSQQEHFESQVRASLALLVTLEKRAFAIRMTLPLAYHENTKPYDDREIAFILKLIGPPLQNFPAIKQEEDHFIDPESVRFARLASRLIKFKYMVTRRLQNDIPIYKYAKAFAAVTTELQRTLEVLEALFKANFPRIYEVGMKNHLGLGPNPSGTDSLSDSLKEHFEAQTDALFENIRTLTETAFAIRKTFSPEVHENTRPYDDRTIAEIYEQIGDIWYYDDIKQEEDHLSDPHNAKTNPQNLKLAEKAAAQLIEWNHILSLRLRHDVDNVAFARPFAGVITELHQTLEKLQALFKRNFPHIYARAFELVEFTRDGNGADDAPMA